MDALAYLFIRLHEHGITVASVFWGLWLFPFGLLVIRCGFIPRALGALLILAGLGYLCSSFAALVLPQYAPTVSQLAPRCSSVNSPSSSGSSFGAQSLVRPRGYRHHDRATSCCHGLRADDLCLSLIAAAHICGQTHG